MILARLNQITGLFLVFEHCSQIEPHQYLVCFVEYWKNKNIEIWDEERKYLDKIDRHRRRKRGGEQKVKYYVCVMGMRNWGSRFLWDSIYIYTHTHTHTYSFKFNERKRESWQMGAWKMLWGGHWICQQLINKKEVDIINLKLETMKKAHWGKKNPWAFNLYLWGGEGWRGQSIYMYDLVIGVVVVPPPASIWTWKSIFRKRK